MYCLRNLSTHIAKCCGVEVEVTAGLHMAKG